MFIGVNQSVIEGSHYSSEYQLLNLKFIKYPLGTLKHQITLLNNLKLFHSSCFKTATLTTQFPVSYTHLTLPTIYSV